MPIINKDKCYQLQNIRKIDPHISLDLVITSKKITSILKLSVTETTKFDAVTIELNIYNKLNQCMGLTSRYVNKHKLIESFLQLQSYFLDDTINDEMKVPLVHKLYEEILTCPSGFHNRVEEIIISLFRPKTISEFLYSQRITIIDKIARKISSNVHTYNSVFAYAHTINFGIEPLCQDEHAVDLSDYNMHVIELTINKNYTALGILNELFINIDSELRTYYAYHGHNNDGYKYGDINKIVNFLQNLFNEKITYEDLLLTNDRDEIYDLNWLAIKNILLNTLLKEQYVFFEQQEIEFFQALYNDTDQQFDNLLNTTNYHVFLRNLELFAYKHLFTHVSQKRKDSVMHLIFYTQIEKLNNKSLLSILTQFNTYHSAADIQKYIRYVSDVWLANNVNFQIMNQCIKRLTLESYDIELIMHFPIDVIKKISGDLFSLSKILYTLIFKEQQYVDLFLSKLKDLTKEDQFDVLQSKDCNNYNVFMSIAKHIPDSLPYIWEIMQNFSPEEQMKLWTHQVHYGRNILMLLLSVSKSSVQNNNIRLNTLEQLIAVLYSRTEEEIFTILSQTEHADKYNIIMIAASINNKIILTQILTLVATLSTKHQTYLWNMCNKHQKSTLSFVIDSAPTIILQVLNFINQLEFYQQVSLLKNLLAETQQTALSLKISKKLLESIILSLNTATPIEQKLYKLLSTMKFNAMHKKLMIIYALADLKENMEHSFNENLAMALGDIESDLAQALCIQRYGGCFFCGNNGDFRKLQHFVLTKQQQELELDRTLSTEIKTKEEPQIYPNNRISCS